MPSYKTYKKSSLQKILFAGNPLCRKSSLQEICLCRKSSLQEIYLCRKSIFGGNLSLEALDADKFEETNLNNVSINIIRYKYNKV